MKKLVILFDCHGKEVGVYLNRCRKLRSKYKIYFITLNSYVIPSRKYASYTKYHPGDLKLIKQADVLITQVIETDRGFLNNKQTLKYTKKGCRVIKIPHYRSSIYTYKDLEGYSPREFKKQWSLFENSDNLSKEEKLNLIKNEIRDMNQMEYDIEEMNNYKTTCLREFKRIDSLSDVKMYDFFINNYQHTRMFKGRSYPTSFFFYAMARSIMKKLKAKNDSVYVENHYADHTDIPIPEYWYKFCNFTFDNTVFGAGHILLRDYEWYYLLLSTRIFKLTDQDIVLKILRTIRN
jgi:hypothetical protein